MQTKKKKEENSERWLLTYADMLTLLFVLFVVLFAFSNVDAAKYQALAASLNSAMGDGSSNSDSSSSVLEGGSGLLEGANSTETEAATSTASSTTSTEQAAMQNTKDNIDKIIAQGNLSNVVSNTIEDSGLVITFPSSIFFASGKSELNDSMKSALNQVSKELNNIDKQILVKGYTDNEPIGKNSQYSSNFELSAIRAINVVEYLSGNCNVSGTRLVAIGCGENDPVASNATVEGRNANRRIEIFIPYSSKGIK